MKTKKYKVSLGNPCQFGWSNMTAAEKGRHCAQCDKTVVDFTIMSDEQVIEYLLLHKNVCGHFNKSQLGRTMVIHAQKPSKKIYWPAIAAMLVAGMFQLSTLQAQHRTNLESFTTGRDVDVSTDLGDHPRLIVDSDTSITIKIRVIDSKSKKQIPAASIDIPGIGKYTSDELGYFQVSFCTTQLPKTININVWAQFYYYYTAEIEISDFIKNPFFNIEMWFDDPNMQIDGGDIDIQLEK